MHRFTVFSSLTESAADAAAVNTFSTAAAAIQNADQLALDATADRYPLKLILVTDKRTSVVIHAVRL